MIPHSKPLLGKPEEAAAARVIRSGHVAQGAECAALEAELAAYLSVEDVVVVSSGSAALHLGLLALVLDIDKPPAQTRIGLPSYVCTALLNAIRHVGSEPHLIDLPPSGYNIIPDHATTSLDALIIPHMFGQAATGLERAGCPVVEDCAMAIGPLRVGGSREASVGLAYSLSMPRRFCVQVKAAPSVRVISGLLIASGIFGITMDATIPSSVSTTK